MDGSGSIPQTITAIDPSDALELMMPKDPPGIVRVKGRVEELRPWSSSKSKSPGPHFYFGRLKSLKTNISIDFRCDADAALSLYQFAILEGVLVYDKQSGSKLCVLLRGSYVGSYIEQETVPPQLKPADAKTKKPLMKFLEGVNGNLSNLLVLGTDTGIHDVLSTLEANTAINTMRVSTLDLDKMVEVIGSSNCAGVVITRGGDDETIDVWDDVNRIKRLMDTGKNFYTAIGHAHRLTMMDLYADQAFLTPTDFGRSASSILVEIEKNKARKRNLEVLQEAQVENGHKLDRLSKSVNKYKIGLIVAGSALLIATGLLIKK